jgi:hypothetical protein
VELCLEYLFSYPWASALHAPVLAMLPHVFRRSPGSGLVAQVLGYTPETMAGEGGLPSLVARILTEQGAVHLKVCGGSRGLWRANGV